MTHACHMCIFDQHQDGNDWLRTFGLRDDGALYFPAAPYTGTDGRAVVLSIWRSGDPDFVQHGAHIYLNSEWLKEQYPEYAAGIEAMEARLVHLLMAQNN